ncbi:MerR family transcriptional regulator [Catenuloplanes japonicus]|uniref:MerR family transcriptional regulator n=1 Tax=Catenuloplanes japonicus TaxID=33876 RepID=UPI0006901969|nr:MerR family transcriptional regulator [Catenuloplanes japonicus]
MVEVDTDVKFKRELLTIGRLATASGVSTRSLRYYEKQGLLTAARTDSGHRRYDPGTIDRVILIQRMFGAGLTSHAIEPLLPCMLDATRRTPFLLDELRRQRDRLRHEIRRQQETVRILDEVIGEYDG